jgi:kinesin family protein 5
MANRDSIKVVCRIRPENEIEKKGAYRRCVEHDDKQIEIAVTAESKVSDMNGNHKFSFDRVFGSEATQASVFQEVAVPTVDGVFNGYNGTIFAYGQTGSGKSFTMEGAGLYDEKLKGLIPRMFEYLFKKIGEAD